MQTLIIGDVHGCYDELQELVAIAGLTSDDDILAVGDLVDRGPQPAAVLEFFRDTANAGSVQGNHELKHVRGFGGELELSRSQVITKAQIGADTYPGWVDFMRGLPTSKRLADALVVHGMYEPGIPLELQQRAVLTGTMSGQRRLRRYARPWYELYDGDVPIVVGHENYSRSTEPFVYRDRVFGLDTGCYTGGALTGLLVPAFRFVSVPARANHWSATSGIYRGVWEAAKRPPKPPRRAPVGSITGRHLIDHLGLTPSAAFGPILSALGEAERAGEFTTVEDGIAYYRRTSGLSGS